MDWWQQQMSFNEWSYDTAQPPVVYTAKIHGKAERVVSVATMEGLWFAYDAKTGRRSISRSSCSTTRSIRVWCRDSPSPFIPGSIGGLNYSPASFDPKTQVRL